MAFTLDLTGEEIKEATKSREWKPLPEGIYGGVIYEAEQKLSSNKNEMYVITLKVLEGPSAGRTIRTYVTMAKNTIFATNALFKAVGMEDYVVTKDDISTGKSITFPDADELLAKQVNFKVKHEPYIGEDENGDDVTKFRDNVKGLFPFDEDKHTNFEEEEDDVPATAGQFL